MADLAGTPRLAIQRPPPQARVERVLAADVGLIDRVHRLVGASKWAPVVLKQATNQSHALADWRERCRAGDHRSRSSGAITVYDLAGRPVERFDLEGVWPVRWEGPSLDSSGSGLAVEELEIAHEGVRVA